MLLDATCADQEKVQKVSMQCCCSQGLFQEYEGMRHVIFSF